MMEYNSCKDKATTKVKSTIDDAITTVVTNIVTPYYIALYQFWQ
jgi:hypothetical protein